jgi:hypothetical protein
MSAFCAVSFGSSDATEAGTQSGRHHKALLSPKTEATTAIFIAA